MADFTALKTAIQTYIKQNGNEEITGEKLQEILLSMVTTLGDSAINDLITALANEVAARQNADGTLQQYITDEATARGNADTALGGRIDDEATARGNGDTALSDRLGSSITAENTAADQIGAEAEARAAADTALQDLIDGITENIENGYVYAGIATPSSTPATGKVFYLALTAGTYTNFGNIEVSQGINILKYNGSAWSLDAFIGIDDTPTPNSPKLVKSGGAFESVMANGSAFDISAHFASGGTLATYANLTAALTALDTLSADYKRGGMSIKFVQSDNKYVQFRYMGTSIADADFTNVANWQGVDAVYKVGGENLIESKGVALSKSEILSGLGIVDFTLDADRAYYSTAGVKQYDATIYYRTLPIEVEEGEVVTFKSECNAGNCVVAALDSNGDFVSESSVAGTTTATSERIYTVPSGIKYLVFCNRYAQSPYVKKQGKYTGKVEHGSDNISKSDDVAKYVDGQNNYAGILPLEILKPEYCRKFIGTFSLVSGSLRITMGEGNNHIVCRVTPGQIISLTSADSSHRVLVFLFSSYYYDNSGDISRVAITADSTKNYNINTATVTFTVPSDTYYLAFDISGNYNYPSKIVVNGNNVTDSFLNIISDYETQNNKEWEENKSVNYLTGETVFPVNNCSLSKFIPLQQNNCPAIIFTEFRNTGGYNYGFALYETTNEDSFIATTELLYSQSQIANGKVVIFIPANANYIRVTSHSTRNPNPHVEYSDYTQSQMLAGGAEEIQFTRGIYASIGSSAVVGATWTPRAEVNENAKLAIVNCHEGDVFTINGIGMTAKSYVVLDADNVVLDAGIQLLKNHVITIPAGSVRLIISQYATPASTCYKGNATIGLMSFWQGTESEFDNLASYPEKRVFIDNESNILNIDHDSILTKEQRNFDKVDYSNDLVNYAHSEASYFQKGDWPRPLLITVVAEGRPMYSNGIFKLYDEDNNLVYEETVSMQTDKNVVKIWNLQPNITYHWELWNSNQSSRFSYGAITPNGYPRFVKVMEGTNRVENVRDLGGWPIAWNKAVRYGLVYRGSDMNWGHTINEAGIAVMKDFLGIGCDIDMRSPSEYSPFLTESPLGNDVEWVNYPTTAYTITSNSGTYYANAIKKIVSNLSNGIVTYFHCKSGADRTGTLSLLILGLLGVSESDLSKEYEFTVGRNRNTLDTSTNRDIPHLMSTIKSYTGSTLQDKIAAWALSYGVTQAEIDTLREKMIIEVNH